MKLLCKLCASKNAHGQYFDFYLILFVQHGRTVPQTSLVAFSITRNLINSLRDLLFRPVVVHVIPPSLPLLGEVCKFNRQTALAGLRRQSLVIYSPLPQCHTSDRDVRGQRIHYVCGQPVCLYDKPYFISGHHTNI